VSSIEPVRCGVIGVGWMGRLHAAYLAGSPLADLLVCCEPNPAAAERAPAGVPVVTQLDDALDTPDLEALVVCTPPDTHVAPVVGALERGLHVLCEKPLATTVADCDAMLGAAAKSSGRLGVGHIRRFDPRFLALAAEVTDGRVGKPLQMVGVCICPREDALRLADHVTLALECAVHDIDAMRWLAGEVLTVYAEGVDQYPTSGVDVFVSTLRFDSGAVGVLQQSWAMPDSTGIDWEFRFHVSGLNGTADVDGRSRGLTVISPEPGHMFPDTMGWPIVGDGIAGALANEDSHFLEGIRTGKDWPLPPQGARAAVVAALAIDRSISTGAPVDVASIG
jgi:predicted dehydrogenase